MEKIHAAPISCVLYCEVENILSDLDDALKKRHGIGFSKLSKHSQGKAHAISQVVSLHILSSLLWWKDGHKILELLRQTQESEGVSVCFVTVFDIDQSSAWVKGAISEECEVICISNCLKVMKEGDVFLGCNISERFRDEWVGKGGVYIKRQYWRNLSNCRRRKYYLKDVKGKEIVKEKKEKVENVEEDAIAQIQTQTPLSELTRILVGHLYQLSISDVISSPSEDEYWRPVKAIIERIMTDYETFSMSAKAYIRKEFEFERQLGNVSSISDGLTTDRSHCFIPGFPYEDMDERILIKLAIRNYSLSGAGIHLLKESSKTLDCMNNVFQTCKHLYIYSYNQEWLFKTLQVSYLHRRDKVCKQQQSDLLVHLQKMANIVVEETDTTLEIPVLRFFGQSLLFTDTDYGRMSFAFRCAELYHLLPLYPLVLGLTHIMVITSKMGPRLNTLGVPHRAKAAFRLSMGIQDLLLKSRQDFSSISNPMHAFYVCLFTRGITWERKILDTQHSSYNRSEIVRKMIVRALDDQYLPSHTRILLESKLERIEMTPKYVHLKSKKRKYSMSQSSVQSPQRRTFESKVRIERVFEGTRVNEGKKGKILYKVPSCSFEFQPRKNSTISEPQDHDRIINLEDQSAVPGSKASVVEIGPRTCFDGIFKANQLDQGWSFHIKEVNANDNENQHDEDELFSLIEIESYHEVHEESIPDGKIGLIAVLD